MLYGVSCSKENKRMSATSETAVKSPSLVLLIGILWHAFVLLEILHLVTLQRLNFFSEGLILYLKSIYTEISSISLFYELGCVLCVCKTASIIVVFIFDVQRNSFHCESLEKRNRIKHTKYSASENHLIQC
jgi:hypothetical protein